jgi:hypothetical protein
MMSSLQQAIQKGMPPDQAVQYVKSMATQGVAPLADLYAMMNQFQRLQQQQVKPPQTPPTIKDQLNMATQQQMQQQRQPGNIQQMQAGAPAPQPMDRGLGAIDAGKMEYPQFNGGGVVALAGGGDTIYMADGPPPSMFERLGQSIGSFGNLGDVYGAQSLAAPVNPMGREISLSGISLEEIAPEFEKALSEGDQEKVNALSAALNRTERGRALETNIRNKVIQERRARETQTRQQGALAFVRGEKPPAASAKTAPTGVGGTNYDTFGSYRTEAGKLKTAAQTEADIPAMQRAQQMQKDLEAMGIGEASRKRGEYLTKREAEAEKDLASDKRMALAQAGFAMAEAASRRGRERTGFLGAAAIGGATGTKLYQAALKENRALKDRIQENRFALDQANEMIKMGNYRDGVAQARQAKDNLTNLNQALATNELGISKFIGEQKGADRRLAVQMASQDKRYAQAAEIAQSRLMQSVLKEAPMLIPGFGKMSSSEQGKALNALLASLAGGAKATTGLDAEILEEE